MTVGELKKILAEHPDEMRVDGYCAQHDSLMEIGPAEIFKSNYPMGDGVDVLVLMSDC